MDNQPTELQNLGQSNLPSPITPPAVPYKRKRRRIKFRLLLPILLVILLLAGGGAAVYSQYSNDPTRVWAQALDRSSDGFMDVIESGSGEPMKGGELKGSLDFDSPLAADGTISGNWYGNSGELKLTMGAAGVRVNSEVIMMPFEGSKSPDIYLRLDGLKGVQSLLGEQAEALMPLIETIDGKWYFMDHTLIDELGSSTVGEQSLSAQDLTDISSKLATVIKSRLLSSDEDIAVLKVDEYLGKEVFEGDNSFKYRVIVQKEQFREFVTEMKDALEETKLKDLMLRNAPEGTTFEEALEFDDLLKEIEDTDFNDSTAEVWVDAKNKLLRNIRISTKGDATKLSYLDIGFDYNGGNDLPFSMKLVNSETDQDYQGSLKLTATFNRSNRGITLGTVADITGIEGKIAGNATITITPSNKEVIVEKPENAENIMELLGGMMQGSADGTSAMDQSQLMELYNGNTMDNSEITQDGI